MNSEKTFTLQVTENELRTLRVALSRAEDAAGKVKNNIAAKAYGALYDRCCQVLRGKE